MSGGNFSGLSFDGRIGGFDVDSTADKHDGYKRQRIEVGSDELEERVKEYKARHERLREDILFAMDGPQAEEVREVLAEAEPAMESAEDYASNLSALLAEQSLLREIARFAIAEHQRRLDEDEDDVIALVLH